MTRPRKEPIEITAEEPLDPKEHLSRRRLMQLAGVSGASFVAGCGGGGDTTPSPTEAAGQSTPTPTSAQTEAQATPTPTEEDTPTPTEAEETEVVDTPTGQVKVTDQWLKDLTSDNFEKLNPNVWNAEGGFLSPFQTLPLSRAPNTVQIPPGFKEVADIIWPVAVRRFELDRDNSLVTINLREDLSWADGTPFDAENLLMHDNIIRAQLDLGEQGETSLPLSMETTGEYSLEAQLLPGNAVLRMITAIFHGTLRRVFRTHPEYHRQFVENIRSATTTSETKTALQELFTTRFPAERLSDMTLGPFQPTDWNPGQMTLEAREDFPWGLHYSDVDRVFKGVKLQTVSEEQNVINAALAGEKDWHIQLPGLKVYQRFPEETWPLWSSVAPAKKGVEFSPKSKFGERSEKGRKLRQAVAYHLDAAENAKVNDLHPVYEQTAGFGVKRYFDNWIGNDTFADWTNYGKKETGYVFEEKGNRAFRDAGFEKNKNGIWVDTADGKPLAPSLLSSVITGSGIALTRPVINNLAEQLNRMGLKATAQIEEGETFVNRGANQDFDLGFFKGQCEVTPHPFMGYREDCGLGSEEGMPVGIYTWDWRNGYRHVEVPMPVGNPDGPLTRFDFDSKVKEMVQITSVEEMKKRVRTLSWVKNQFVPTVYMHNWTIRATVNTDRINVTEDFNPKNLATPFSGAPRFFLAVGWWQPP